MYSQMQYVPPPNGSLFLMLTDYSVIIVGGHETTANTLSWALFEMTKNVEIQNRLRAEIRKKIQDKGNDVFTEQEYESMPYLNAIVKVRSNPLNVVSFLIVCSNRKCYVCTLSYPLS